MAHTFQIRDTKEHFQFIPKSYREEVKLALAVPAFLACLTLFIMLALHS